MHGMICTSPCERTQGGGTSVFGCVLMDIAHYPASVSFFTFLYFHFYLILRRCHQSGLSACLARCSSSSSSTCIILINHGPIELRCGGQRRRRPFLSCFQPTCRARHLSGAVNLGGDWKQAVCALGWISIFRGARMQTEWDLHVNELISKRHRCRLGLPAHPFPRRAPDPNGHTHTHTHTYIHAHMQRKGKGCGRHHRLGIIFCG
ncbi:hypothetical protein LY78DRAFT_25595 [Colletotrichum sublineola]|nr:hypothetical protein LY78DRAFT_25595 [Colletotrichum sublineola]